MIYEQQLKSKSLCHGNAMNSSGHTAQLHVAHASVIYALHGDKIKR